MKKYSIATLLILLLIALCLLMLGRVHRRLVVSINGFHQHASSITIGSGNSGICFHKVPEHFMKVTHQQGSFSWEVNPRYVKADSLCYYKVNGKNPNLHPIGEGDSIVVSVGKKTLSLTHDQIEDVLSGITSQYVLLRNVLDIVSDHSALDVRPKDDHGLKSFLWRTRSQHLWGTSYGDWQLVILDRRTRLAGASGVIAYADHGTTLELTPQQADIFKIQFFYIADYSYQTNKADRHSLNIDGVNYQAKAMLSTTEWTAGHALIKPSAYNVVKGLKAREGLDVFFPKAVTYVEDLDTLRSFMKSSTNMLTMMQMDGSFPVARNLYVPHFSGAVSQYICNIFLDNDSVMLRNGETTLKVKTGWNLLPSLQKTTFRSAQHEELFVSCGLINYRFILSYLWLPLVIFLLIILVWPWLTDTSKIVHCRGLNTRRADLTPYFRTIAFLAFAWCVCKVMIAFKLSYTFPYFEELTGVVTVSAALMLMLFFVVSLILNRDFLTATLRNHQRSHRHWIALGLSVVGVLLCYIAMRWMDSNYNAPFLNAYLPDDLFSVNLFRWQELSGMNDLHRSIPYSLLFANLSAMVILFVMTLPGVSTMKNPLEKWMSRYYALVDKWSPSPTLLQGRGEKTTTAIEGASNVLFFLLKYALVPLLLVFLVSLLPGNFATAFITLFLIIGMSWTLSNITFKHGRIVAFVEMIVVALLFVMAAAVKADMGYTTNLFGIFFAVIFFYFMQERGGYDFGHQQANKMERRWIPRLMILSVIFVFSMPMLLSRLLDTEKVAYSRATRRFNMYSQFEKYRNSGYRYALSDTEFMTVMVHYMYNISGKDPLSNEHHFLHPSVSSGQSPVVLNDVSLQGAFFGAYGLLAYVVYFGLLALLAWLVLTYSFHEPSGILHAQLRWRVLAVLMWVGTTLYLYISYLGQLPFTGRLNPGFGVDSVGEMLETALLLSFMTATALKIEKVNIKNG
ncbi:MAG: hypothetical protein IKX61_04610 [Prevotella sp.]|nr:hypothetical protein [Prevotella sp.]